MSQSPKDQVIKRLKSQLEIYKAKLEEVSFDSLSGKISELESEIAQKDQLIADFKSTAQMSGVVGEDTQNIRTKMIVLQSKNRKQESEITQLTSEIEDLNAKIERIKKTSGGSQDTSLLKRQLKQETETSNRLREQINSLSGQNANTDQYKRRIQELESKITQLENSRSNSMGQYSSPSQNNDKIQELQEENGQLKEQLEGINSGGGGSLMGSLRLQREVAQLKSKIEMLKKDNEQMQKKYQEVMRKQEFNLDDGW